MKKSKIILAVVFLILGVGIGVFADNINETIQALKCYDVNIKYNNTVQSMYDVNGNRVYPLNYNGTTYVPIRAVSNIFDVAVDWDNATRTVLLGENSDWEYLEASNIDDLRRKNWYQNNLNYTFDGQTYKTGYKEVEDEFSMFTNYYFFFDLGIKYKQLSCKAIVESTENNVPVKIKITDKDTGSCKYEKNTFTNVAEDILVDVTGCDRMECYVAYNGSEYEGKEATLYIVDMKAK